MGFLDSLGTKPIEKRWQCLVGDDDTFWFRKLELEDTFLVARDKTKAVTHGWKDIIALRFPTPGYKQAHVPSCSFTFSHPRDIIFEVVPGMIPNYERPDGGRTSKRPDGKITAIGELDRLREVIRWCANVGNQRLLKVAAKKSKQPSMDRLIMWLGVGFVVELFILLLTVALGGGIKLS